MSPDARAAVVVFVLAFGGYATSKVKIQTDSIWSIPTAASLLHEGNLNLDEFRPTFAITHHGVRPVGEHAYYEYPVGVVLAAAPLLFMADTVLGAVDLGERARKWEAAFHATGTIDLGFYNRTENLIASFYVALAVVVVFLTARRKASLPSALAVAALFAFGTSAYSTASRVLWAHTPSLLAIAVIVWLLTRPTQTARSMAALGVAVAAAYVCRPTNALTVIAVSALVVLRHRGFMLAYLGGALAVAVPFCSTNWLLYQSVLSPYYLQHLVSSFDVRPFAAQLISPSRGLLTFSPVLVFALVQMAKQIRRRELDATEVMFVGVLLAHWLLISSFYVWWGGHSVGPRFFTDVLPYLVWFLIAPVSAVVDAPRARPVVTALLVLTATLSIVIHARSSIIPAVHGWNDGPPTSTRRLSGCGTGATPSSCAGELSAN